MLKDTDENCWKMSRYKTAFALQLPTKEVIITLSSKGYIQEDFFLSDSTS